MTNNQMLERTYEMLELAIQLKGGETAAEDENVRNMLLSEGFMFGDTIRKLTEEIDQETAKRAGRGTQRAAMNRIIKEAIKANPHRPQFHGAWIAPDDSQIVCSGYAAIKLYEPLELPQTEGGDLKVFDYPTASKPLELPTIGKLKTIIADHKIKWKGTKAKERPAPIYDFGENLPAVNAQYLIDVMEALPGVKIIQYTTPKSPLYFEIPLKGIGILCPVRKQEEEGL